MQQGNDPEAIKKGGKMNWFIDWKMDVIVILVIIVILLTWYIISQKLISSAFFKQVWGCIAPFLQGGTPESSNRLAFLFSVFLSNVCLWGAWVVITIASNWQVIYNPAHPVAMPNIPEGVLWAYAAANGIAFAGKVTQSRKKK
jgi:hypothetical protein